MPETAIVDTSALIALEKIDLLGILCRLYAEILLPEAVIREFGEPSIDCYTVRRVESPLVGLMTTELNLGKGESQVIALAIETGLRVILDDLKARKVAETLGLNLTGTIGILLKASNMGLIDSAYAKARELRDKGFHVSEHLLNDLLQFGK